MSLFWICQFSSRWVENFVQSPLEAGGWGAVLVRLKQQTRSLPAQRDPVSGKRTQKDAGLVYELLRQLVLQLQIVGRVAHRRQGTAYLHGWCSPQVLDAGVSKTIYHKRERKSSNWDYCRRKTTNYGSEDPAQIQGQGIDYQHAQV